MYYLIPDNYYRDDLDNREVMVSILCITYNHEKYIRETLEGFVTQKTNFRFEAIVHDDCSTDNTAAIIREYAEKYPSIIKPIFETENQYCNSKGNLGRTIRGHTRGKYVAYCEGDDYWINSLKLQKQVDFLETHNDFSMCFHNAIEHIENGGIEDHLFSDLREKEYCGLEIYENWIVPTASVIVRRQVTESDLYLKAQKNKKIIVGDLILFLTASSLGKIFAINEVMSVYRRHYGGVTYNSSIDRDLKLIEQQKAIVEIFGPQYKDISKMHISNVYIKIHNKLLARGKYLKAFLYLLRSLNYNTKPAKELIKRKMQILAAMHS